MNPYFLQGKRAWLTGSQHHAGPKDVKAITGIGQRFVLLRRIDVAWLRIPWRLAHDKSRRATTSKVYWVHIGATNGRRKCKKMQKKT